MAYRAITQAAVTHDMAIRIRLNGLRKGTARMIGLKNRANAGWTLVWRGGTSLSAIVSAIRLRSESNQKSLRVQCSRPNPAATATTPAAAHSPSRSATPMSTRWARTHAPMETAGRPDPGSGDPGSGDTGVAGGRDRLGGVGHAAGLYRWAADLMPAWP